MAGRHRHRLPRRGARRRQGPDRLRRRARRPGRPDVPHPLRVDAAGLRHLERRRDHRPGVRDQFGRADPVDPRRLGRRRPAWWRPTRTPPPSSPSATGCPAWCTSGRSSGAPSHELRAAGDARSPTARSTSAARVAERRLPGHHRLHLRHHRPPQGLRAHPPQLLRRVRQRRRAAARRSSAPASASVLLFLPVAHVFGRLVAGGGGDGADQARPRARTSSTSPTNSPPSGRPWSWASRASSRRSTTRRAPRRRPTARARSSTRRRTPRSRTAARSTRRAGPSLGLKVKYKVFDKLVYSKLRAVLGGRGHPRDLRRRPARRAAGPLLPRHRLHRPGGLRPDGVLRGHRLQPLGPPEDRHGRPAAARLGRPHRRRRRGAAARRAPLHRSTGTTRRPPRRRWPTAGSTPATSARSTRTATSPSPAARRRSWSPRAARTSPPP